MAGFIQFPLGGVTATQLYVWEDVDMTDADGFNIDANFAPAFTACKMLLGVATRSGAPVDGVTGFGYMMADPRTLDLVRANFSGVTGFEADYFIEGEGQTGLPVTQQETIVGEGPQKTMIIQTISYFATHVRPHIIVPDSGPEWIADLYMCFVPRFELGSWQV